MHCDLVLCKESPEKQSAQRDLSPGHSEEEEMEFFWTLSLCEI